MSEIKYFFSWGDTKGLRKMTLDKFFNFALQSSVIDWDLHGGYAPHEGKPELLLETHKLIKTLTGREYKHVLITAGATNALNAYLYAKKTTSPTIDDLCVFTNKLYYRMYPQIIENQNMIHLKHDTHQFDHSTDLAIIDSPSNPEGKLNKTAVAQGVVWDAAYHSPTYLKDSSFLKTFPEHEAMVGSYSKFSSINGIRVGWLATNDPVLYSLALDYVKGDACTVNSIGQELISKFLKTVDLEAFWKAGKNLLDDNRTEVQKLQYMFEPDFIPDHGMFAFSKADGKIANILQEACVEFSSGFDLGDSEFSYRINLANTREETRDMVKAILKVDGK
jgi:aspartate/methionine/tyrosine aminotransferase